MKVVYTDSLVIGAGLAGLRVAVASKMRGLDTLILSLIPAKRSHSAAAQGGMQASLGAAAKGEGDNEDIHFADTVKGSDWGCDQPVARMFTHVAPKAIRELAAWGVPWSRVRGGDHEVVINAQRTIIHEKEEAHGLIMARDFGGTKKWRTCYTSDGAGHTMLYAMDNKAIELGIPVHERMEAVALIHEGDRCRGAVVRDLITGELIAYVAKATTIATGGYGRIYGVTTNAVIVEGMGAAIALETGKAPLGNMEAVQFHPTAIVPVGILMTEGCRGDGGVLRDVDGYRFMPDYEPEKKELASRDVVSRRMTEHMRKGKGVPSPYGDHLWLDITILGKEHIERNLREVTEICRNFLGVDPVKDYIPVRPTQHYSMGGVRTNWTGESPGLRGLFSVGEAACWDLHGFNRLGGNSVAETVVSGMIVGEYVADYCEQSTLEISTGVIAGFMERERARIDALLARPSGEKVYELRSAMQQIMMDKVGIFRTGEKLQEALDGLKDLLRRSRNIALTNKIGSSNPELVDALRLQRQLKLAVTVTKGALLRTESRGAHTREDYPERNDRDWLKRTLAYWKNEADEEPTIEYEDLDISKMELPPGFRGYGTDNTIHHPNTAGRVQQAAEIVQSMPGADRFQVQNALMPFDLPAKYKEKNERIGVGCK
ncbi:MAG: fumarate reductase flavoprotein subunit [Nitrospirae bacterium CG18_big_fil_WC_8_21_14_2_50_70_55]|nr:fumarate reductase flavoprotein subunit [Deltaproteobacteria bacterium]OIP65026.1 MAG: fumarate reductase flavoprotein subunit [Nitrospirae bacterium CG2_30_70_394]PIQ04313.1 MAG: fumarate reductase flavoprotein subunit [Nitrospirae bacterium CG18_big_fil_WC_8_21_14_2_50_70_55]PIU78646.1 MAG: fumarate reductase flavoprotein subunit [Nitrospirae bacterium CG06_land_8_20_14_3_00_70_43]PIW83634.1 MAG: fumarate reductase flavoprotein subunit [Nitrospirae bacterium CG_4_8_14_3_um_filter_70_85]PI